MPVPHFQTITLGRKPRPFSHPNWLFELKWDGFRALFHSEKEGVRLVSRNGNTFKSFPAVAILASLDPRESGVIANCPVVDWTILDRSEKIETRKENYAEYIREAFENGYRLSDANWEKLRSGVFYSPWHRRSEITASKVMIFHAKDDPHVPYDESEKLAEITGVILKSLKRGGHISTDFIVRRYWTQIKKFFDSARNK